MSRFTERDRLHLAVVTPVALIALNQPTAALLAAGLFLGLEVNRAFDDYYSKRNDSDTTGKGRLRLIMGKRPRQ